MFRACPDIAEYTLYICCVNSVYMYTEQIAHCIYVYTIDM